jgi:4-aminobutyrate aminotransferase/(S)-3-amino-2-methylpropionate transaminase
MGDLVRAYQAQVIIESVDKYNLLDVVQETGSHMKRRLFELQNEYPDWIQNVRGTGTYMAFDVETPQKRDILVKEMRQMGVNMGGSGERAIRMRPMLIFEETHADVYLDILEDNLGKLKDA